MGIDNVINGVEKLKADQQSYKPTINTSTMPSPAPLLDMSNNFNEHLYELAGRTPGGIGTLRNKASRIAPKDILNRTELFENSMSEEFNYYKHMKPFEMKISPETEYDKSGNITKTTMVTNHGIKSLFSNISAVYSNDNMRESLNMPLLDGAEVRKKIKERTDCSVKALVDASGRGDMGLAVYNYGDFMYCKYLGRVPNNYMITLRRFPLPVPDHIDKYKDDEETTMFPDMGRMITWLGTPGNEMSNILKYSYNIPWSEQKAPVRDPGQEMAGEAGGGTLGQLLSGLSGSFGADLAKSNGMGIKGNDNVVASFFGFQNSGGGIDSIYEPGNKIYANEQNLIMSTIVPGSANEGGLKFTHDISLQFDYELRSIDGINARSAMADLIANILVLTYLEGKFYPGSHRAAFHSRSSIYSNLAIFQLSTADMKNPNKIFDSAYTSMQQILNGLGFTKGSTAAQTRTNAKNAILAMAGNILQLAVAGAINKLGRPQMLAFNSFISPQPTGQWHLTIGNPRNPILTIGNLILDSASIEHYGPLGLDDFPTGLRVNVTLKHGKPRDSVAIENMYTRGDVRIYNNMGEDIEKMYSEKIAAGAKNTKSSGSADTNVNSTSKATSTSAKESSNKFSKFFGSAANDPRLYITTAKSNKPDIEGPVAKKK